MPSWARHEQPAGLTALVRFGCHACISIHSCVSADTPHHAQDREMRKYSGNASLREPAGRGGGMSAQYLESIEEEADYEDDRGLTATERARQDLHRPRRVDPAAEVWGLIDACWTLQAWHRLWPWTCKESCVDPSMLRASLKLKPYARVFTARPRSMR